MGSAPLTKPQLTCVTFTADIRCVMHKVFGREGLEARFQRRLPCFAVGYSAGGTMLIMGIAQELQLMEGQTTTPHMHPEGFPFECCVCLSAPYDMATHAASMLTRVGRLLYQAPLVTALRKYTHKHRAVLVGGLPGVPQVTDRTVDAFMARLKTVEDFDEHVVAPHFGYKCVEDYYADGSLFKWLPHLHTIPVVCAAARDDPVTGHSLRTADWQRLVDHTNPNVAYVETPTGGHLGYMLGPVDEWRTAPCFLDHFPVDCIDHLVAAKAADPSL
ncbi:hypothetical protein STCU_11744 [Strigomonas culicis]|uniref:AB hydrolase-1 domain-containing protein n=1 Tax=Strigomonas culicis TaxID=28005 RepID=S9TFS8_9TRYP|nr:hypothetical protein STCU_11744 [Strigomonas culicis]|eukprot:EPY15819.1 hypothetical protein STCU_11744 [Strigomonas culicis]